MQRKELFLLLMLMLACLSQNLSQVSAQDAATQNDAEATAKGESEDLWERLIYLPYKNLKEVFEKQDATVFMPYLEYLKLWQGQAAGPEGEIKPPVSALITSAIYKATIEKNFARIEVEYSIQVLGKPWSEIPLNFGKAAVGKVTGSNEKTFLRGIGQGKYSLLLPEKGAHKVRFELLTRVHTSPDGRSFQFNCPAVGITTFELTVPEADQTVQLTPQLVQTPVESGPKETKIKATLGATTSIAAKWNPRTSIKPDMDLLASVTNLTHVSLEDGLLHTNTFLTYDILRGELKELRIVVPEGCRILDVNSGNAKIKGWRTLADDKRQIIVVEFLGAINKQVTIEVHTETAIPEESFLVGGLEDSGETHGVHALDAVRESGQLVVTYGSQLSLAVEQQQGLIRVTAAEVDKRINRPNSLYFKFFSPKYQFRIAPRPVEPRVTVSQQALLIFGEDELQLRSTLTYKIEKAGLFELKLKVPEDLSVDRVEGASVKEHQFDESSRVLTVVLNEKKQGDIGINFFGRRKLEDGAEEDEQLLPLLEPLNVFRDTGRISVFAPDAIEVITKDDDLVGVQPDPVQPAVPNRNVRLIASWSYTRRPVSITVKTVRKPTRLTAKVGTSIHVQQGLTEITSTIDYTVEYAGIDTFKFDVPAAIADRVQIRSVTPAPAPAIKQKSRAEEAVDGWVTWTVVMQRDVTGVHRFSVRYDLKPGAEVANKDETDETKKSAESNISTLVIQPLKVLGLAEDDSDAGEVPLSRVTGEISILKDRALSITAEPKSENLETIDVRELVNLPQSGDMAFRYFKQPVELKVQSTKFEIQKVIDTVISKALVEVVLGKDTQASYRCRYRLKSTERQRLPLDLPAGAETLAVLVDGQSVPLENSNEEPEAGWKSFFLNVARTKRSDEPFYVSLQFQVPFDGKPFEGLLGGLNLQLPRLGGTGANSAAVQQLETVIWIPEEYDLVGSPENFVSKSVSYFSFPIVGRLISGKQSYPELDAWIGSNSAGMIDFPTAGHAYRYGNLQGAELIEVRWWDIGSCSWILSIAIFLIAIVQRNTSWENKLMILLIAAFAAALYALRDVDVVVQILSAARIGILAMMGYWIIHTLFRLQPVKVLSAGIPADGMAAQAAVAVIPPPGIFDDVRPNSDS